MEVDDLGFVCMKPTYPHARRLPDIAVVVWVADAFPGRCFVDLNDMAHVVWSEQWFRDQALRKAQALGVWCVTVGMLDAMMHEICAPETAARHELYRFKPAKLRRRIIECFETDRPGLPPEDDQVRACWEYMTGLQGQQKTKHEL